MAKKTRLNKRFVILMVSIGVLLLLVVATVVASYQPKDPDQLAAKAAEEAKAKRYDAAIADLGQAVNVGHKPEHYLTLGNLMIERRKEDKGLPQSEQWKLVRNAMQCYREAVRYDGGGRTQTGMAAQRKLVELFEANAGGTQDWETYIKEANELLRMDPKDNATRFKVAQAKFLMMATRPEYGDQALEEYKQLVEVDPSKEDYWLGLIGYYFRARNEADGVETFKKAMEAVPDSVRLRVSYAEYLQTAENKKPDEALALLTDTLNKHADNVDAYLALASYYQRQTQYDKAKEILQKAIDVQSVDYRPYSQLANLYLFTKDNDKVMPLLQQGLDALRKEAAGEKKLEGVELARHREGMVWLNYILCDTLLDMIASASPEEKDKLMASLDEALGEMTGVVAEHPLVDSIRGRKALLKGDLVESERLLRSAYDKTRDRKTAQALVNIYLRTSQPGEAKKIIQSLVGMSKDDAMGALSLARMCAELEQYDDAQTAVEEIVRKHPEIKEAVALSAAMKVIKGSLTRIPEDVREFDPFATTLFMRKAEEYWNQGDQDPALRLMQDLYDRQPRNLAVILDLIVWRQTRNEAVEVQALMDKVKKDLVNDPGALERLNMALVARVDPTRQVAMQLEMIDKTEKNPIARLIRRANILNAGGDREKAVAELNEVIKQEPSNPDAVALLFSFAVDKNDWENAQKYADLAAKENLDKAQGKWFQAIIYHTKREPDKAIELLNEVVQQRPRFSQAHGLLGDCYLMAGQFDKAKEEFTIAYDQDPKNVQAIQGLINIAERTGQMADYNTYISQAYRMFPNNQQVRERYLQLQESQDLSKAIRQREQVARSQPRDVTNLMRLAMLYERSNQVMEAGRIYQALYEASPRDPVTCRVYANFLLKTNREADARSLMAKFADAAENKMIGLLFWADFLEHAGQIDQAKSVYEKALQVDIGGDAYLNVARFYQRQGDWPQAIKYQKEYAQRVKNKDQLAGAHFQLIEYLINGKQFDESQKMIDALLKDNPNDPDALTARAAWYMGQKEYAKARDVLDGVLSTNAQAMSALVARADANLAAGDTTAAVADLEAARRAQPRMSQQISLRLAQLYAQIGDLSGADLLLQTINNEAPDFVPAKEMRARIMIQKQQWEPLVQYLAAARRAHPKETIFPKLEAQMWLQRKQVEKALASLVDARAVAVGAEQVDIDMLAAQMLVEADQYDKALTVTPALEQDPRVARRAMALTGRALAKKGDEAGAEKAFTTALKGASVPEIDYIVAQIEGAYPKATAGANLKKWESLGEDGWRIPMHVGRIMGELGDNAGAVEALLAAATKAPEGKDKLSLYNVLGLTYQSMGKYDEAAKTFQIACKLEPNDGVMNNNLAYCLGLSMNKYAEALPYAERAYKLAPNNPNILDTYGMILVNLDRLKEAEDALNRGLKVVSLASSRYYLGLSLEKQGRKDDALEQYRLGWEMIKKDEKDPSYQKLKDGIARLGGSE